MRRLRVRCGEGSRRRTKLLSSVAVAVAALALLPDVSVGQLHEGWATEIRGGLAAAGDRLADLTGTGPSVGVGLRREVAPGLAVRVDTDLDVRDGESFVVTRQPLVGDPVMVTTDAPGFTFWHVAASAELEVTGSELTPWSLAVSAGGGMTLLDTEEYFAGIGPDDGPVFEDVTELYPAVRAAVAVGWHVSRRARLQGTLAWRLLFTSESDFRGLSEALDGQVEPLGRASLLPVTLGLSLQL